MKKPSAKDCVRITAQGVAFAGGLRGLLFLGMAADVMLDFDRTRARLLFGISSIVFGLYLVALAYLMVRRFSSPSIKLFSFAFAFLLYIQISETLRPLHISDIQARMQWESWVFFVVPYLLAVVIYLVLKHLLFWSGDLRFLEQF